MKLGVGLLLFVLLAGCAPSQTSIQTAIAQTQGASPKSTLTITIAKVPVLLPTNTYAPTFTPRPKPTETQAPNYILEFGFCVMGVKYQSGNPDDEPGCGVDQREQVYIPAGASITASFPRYKDRQNYCALFTLQGEFLMAYVDTKGNGKVACTP